MAVSRLLRFQFMVTLYMQQLLGLSALEKALGFPPGLPVAFGARRMRPLATRFGMAPLITGACSRS